MAQPPRPDARRREDLRPASNRPLIVLGLVALAGFAIASLPASLVAGRLQPLQVSAAAYSGTIWTGSASGLAWRGVQLGDLDWSLKPSMLLRGRLAADVTLSRPDGSLTGDIAAGLGGRIEMHSVQVDLPLAALSAVPAGILRGWQGRVRGSIDELLIVAGWPDQVRGTLDVTGLVSPSATAFGDYRVVFPDPGSPSDGSNAVTARIADQGGPLSVDARLTLSEGRSFLVEGTVAPRGQVQESLQLSLQFLGPADASGRRPFSVSGTL